MQSCPKFLDKDFKRFKCLTDKNKKIGVISSFRWKGMIQYEKLKSCKGLDARPKGECFVKSDFFQLAKNGDYKQEGVQKSHKFLDNASSRKHFELSKIYNIQDTNNIM